MNNAVWFLFLALRVVCVGGRVKNDESAKNIRFQGLSISWQGKLETLTELSLQKAVRKSKITSKNFPRAVFNEFKVHSSLHNRLSWNIVLSLLEGFICWVDLLVSAALNNHGVPHSTRPKIPFEAEIELRLIIKKNYRRRRPHKNCGAEPERFSSSFQHHRGRFNCWLFRVCFRDFTRICFSCFHYSPSTEA